MSALVLVLGRRRAACSLGIAAGYWLPPHGRLAARDRPRPVRRILLPFTGQAISRRSFEAAVRLAKAENAIVMPAFLARVPMNLPLDSALPVQCASGMPLLEAIEQRALLAGHPGRLARRARALGARRAAQPARPRSTSTASSCPPTKTRGRGSSYDDLRWLLERVPAEILILRPAPEDTRRITTKGISGHF